MRCIIKRTEGGRIDRVINPIALGRSKNVTNILIEHLRRNLGQEVIVDVQLFEDKLKEFGLQGVTPMTTKAGEAYGFFHEGKIYLDPKLINSDTIFHEFQHANELMLNNAAKLGDTRAQVLLDKRNEIVDPIVEQVKTSLNARFPDQVGEDVPFSLNAQGQFQTRDGQAIGFEFDTNQVARERFDISKLTYINEGSDRSVFDLGDGRVLKIAHSARGLVQNIHEGNKNLVGHIPDIYERGLNYVVAEKVNAAKSQDQIAIYNPETGEAEGTTSFEHMIDTFYQYLQTDFDAASGGDLVMGFGLENTFENFSKRNGASLKDALKTFGLSEFLPFDVIWGDFRQSDNWGIKDGKPILIDAGTLGGVKMLRQFRDPETGRNKENLDDNDFLKVYEASQRAKERFGDTDSNVMFQVLSDYRDNNKFTLSELIYPDVVFKDIKTEAEAKIATDFYTKIINRFNKQFDRNIQITSQKSENGNFEIVVEYETGTKPKYFAYPTATMGEHEVVPVIDKNVPLTSLRHELLHEALVKNITDKFEATNAQDNSAQSQSIEDVQRQRAFTYTLEDVFFERVVENIERKPDNKDTFPIDTFGVDVVNRVKEELGDKEITKENVTNILYTLLQDSNAWLKENLIASVQKTNFAAGDIAQQIGNNLKQRFDVAKNIFSKELQKDIFDFTEFFNEEYQGVLTRLNKAGKRNASVRNIAGNTLFSEPLADAVSIAQDYMKSVGKTFVQPSRIYQLDETRSKAIAEAYSKMQDDRTNPDVKASYEALAKEIVGQYKAIKKAGYNVEINDTDPYGNSQEMIKDLKDRKTLKVASTESLYGEGEITEEQRENNPMLRVTEVKDINGKSLLVNDVFRFVHDFFGHAELGNGFGPVGEENAWNVHSRMFSDVARRAMTTETRGQNSYVNFSGVNDEAFKLRDDARRLRAQGRTAEARELSNKAYEMMSFAEQKIGLLPEEFSDIPTQYTALQPKIEGMSPLNISTQNYARATNETDAEWTDRLRGEVFARLIGAEGQEIAAQIEKDLSIPKGSILKSIKQWLNDFVAWIKKTLPNFSGMSEKSIMEMSMRDFIRTSAGDLLTYGTVRRDMFGNPLERKPAVLKPERRGTTPFDKRKRTPAVQQAINTEVFDPTSIAMQMILNGTIIGKTSRNSDIEESLPGMRTRKGVMTEIFGGRKRMPQVLAEQNTRLLLLRTDGMTLDEMAHEVWMNQPVTDRFTDQDFKEALIDIYSNYFNPVGLANAINEKYNPNVGPSERDIREARESSSPYDPNAPYDDSEFLGDTPIDEVPFQIIGEQANLDEDVRNNLQVAREMEATGKDSETIFLATGWERGADNKWRYDLLDGNIIIRDFKAYDNFNKNAEKDPITTLEYVYDSEALYKAYPELRNYQVIFSREWNFGHAMYTSRGFAKVGTIYVSYNQLALPDSLESILLHEIQHAIQEIEGFAVGGSPEDIIDTLFAKYKARNKFNNYTITEDEGRFFTTDDLGWMVGEGFDTREAAEAHINKAKEELEGIATTYQSLIDNKVEANEAYRRLAGEVEARNAQDRMLLSDDQRKRFSISGTEDVRREDQITYFENTRAFSLDNDVDSELFNLIISNPHIKDAEQAKDVLLNVYSEKFVKEFGNWENEEVHPAVLNLQGEPKLFYRTPGGFISESFSEALQNTSEGQIEAGFVATEDVMDTEDEELFNASLADFSKFKDQYKLENPESFISVFKVNADSNPSTVSGLTNKLIRQGILSGQKVKGYDGLFRHKGAGMDLMTEKTNIVIAQNEAVFHLGAKNVFTDSQGLLEFKGENPNVISVINEAGEQENHGRAKLIEALNAGKYAQVRAKVGNLGAFLYNNFRQSVDSAFTSRSANPVSPQEESTLRTQMLTLLSNMGISVTTLTDYVKNYKLRNGIDLSVEAIADVSNNVVAFAEGKMTDENIVEETAHIVIEASNQDEINALLPSVVDTEEYIEYADEYLDKYGKLYSGEDLDKAVRKEVLGKILANSIRDNFVKDSPVKQSLLDILNRFIEKITSYFIPNQRKQLNEFIQRTTDIVMRRDAHEFLDKDLLSNSAIVLYSVNGSTINTAQRRNLKLRAQLEKLKQSLEIRKRTQAKLNDPEVSRLTSAINKLDEDIVKDDLVAAATVSIAIHDSQIAALTRQLGYYKKQTTTTGKKPFFNQGDQASYKYLKDIALPIMKEMRGLVAEDNPSLALKLEGQMSAIANLEGDVYAQQLDDVEAMVNKVVEGYSILEEEKQKIRDDFSREQKDITGLQSLFGQLGHASNAFLNFLGKLINQTYYNAEIKTLSALNPILAKAQAAEWNIGKFRNIIKRDSKGKNSGYLLSKIDYAKFDAAVEEFESKAFNDILTEDQKKALAGKTARKSDLTIDQLQEFNRREIAWKDIHEERAMLAEYYTQVEQELTDAKVGVSNRAFLSELSARTYKIKAKYRDENGKIDYSQMAEEDIDALAQITLERKSRKSEFDAVTGERKRGQELTEAKELQALDKLRSEKAIKRGTSRDFFEALRDVENTKGTQAAYEFMMSNGGLVFSDTFWESLGVNASIDERVQRANQMLMQEGDAIGANTLSSAFVNYVEASDARKEILKQYATPNNPAEINTALMPQVAMDNILRLEEVIQENQVLMNSQLKKTGEDPVTPSLTENTVNESYLAALKDSKIGEDEFISKHLTKGNKSKFDAFKSQVDRVGRGVTPFMEKGFKRYIANTYGADINDIESIKDAIQSVGVENMVVAYGRSKIGSYYKRFAPAGYEQLLDSIKNGASVYNLAVQIENKSPGFENYSVSTRFEWAELDAANSMVNPLYQDDVESGFRRPKASIYRDQEYYNRYNPDASGKATTNVEEFEMLETFKTIMKASLGAYGEKGRNINKLPQKSRQAAERGLKNRVSGFKESVKDIIQNRTDDLQYGEALDGVNAAELGVNLIPKYFLNDLENKEDISEDLMHSYAALLREANLYDARVNTVGEAMLLQSKLLNSSFEGGKTPDTTQTAKMFKNFMDAYYFGIKNSKKQMISVLGKEYDVSKMAIWFDHLVRKVNVGFSIPVAASSAAVSNINLLIENRVGEHTHAVSARWATGELTKLLPDYASSYGKLDRTDKLYLLGETFGAHTVQDKTANAGYNKAVKALSDLPFAFMSIMATPHSNSVMLSILDDFRLVGDKIYSYNEFRKLPDNVGLTRTEVEGNWKKYRDNSMYNLLDQREGTMRFKEAVEAQIGAAYADSQLQRARTKIREVNGNIDALISSEDKSAATRHWLLSFLTAHKGWLAIGIQRRFKRQHFNFNTGDFEQGHYRSLALFLKDLLKLGRANGYANAVKQIGKEWKNLDDIQRKNIGRVGKDLAVFILLTGLSVWIANIDDDEKNKDNWPIHMLSYIYFRTTSEVGSSQLPFGLGDAVETLKSPIVAVSSVSSFMKGMSLDEVQSGAYKGQTKLTQAIIKQTYLRHWYDLQQIKKKSDYYRLLNSSVLLGAQKEKKEDEDDVPEGMGIIEQYNRGIK